MNENSMQEAKEKGLSTMDITAKRAAVLASMQFPTESVGRIDSAEIRLEEQAPVEMRDGEPFFGGYMMDDMLEDMGVNQVEEATTTVSVKDLS
ncbi:MAG: hypothetical protein OXR68_03435 [Alphaproteobacteria bacterium]|nr:hypothetical protein [Alphaproteobacteria bacterium]MDD9919659.1 hypothetical protein [Alphaproteobacteria bacterium]